MNSLASDIEHEVVPSLTGVSRDKSTISSYYETLFANVQGESVTPLRRYYGGSFVVDETM